MEGEKLVGIQSVNEVGLSPSLTGEGGLLRQDCKFDLYDSGALLKGQGQVGERQVLTFENAEVAQSLILALQQGQEGGEHRMRRPLSPLPPAFFPSTDSAQDSAPNIILLVPGFI